MQSVGINQLVDVCLVGNLNKKIVAYRHHPFHVINHIVR
jgi:hypothetical protein